MLHVPYKGSAPMMTDLLGGQVVAAIDAATTSWPQVKAGKLRALGIAGSEKAFFAPELPLIKDSVAGFDVKPWHGLMAPAGTPEAVLKILSSVVVEGANTERAAKLRESFSIPNKPKNLVETRRDWERDVPVWVKLAVDLGIKLD